LAQRYLIGLLNARWQTMTDDEKSVYNSAAQEYFNRTKKYISGYNYWIKIALTDLDTYYGLACFYPFNEGSGLVAYDHSGNNFNGIFYPSSVLSYVQYVESENDKFGTCVDCDGSNQYIEVASDPKLNFSEEITLSAWVKLNEKNTARSYLVTRAGSYSLVKESNNILNFLVRLGAVNYTVGIPASNWSVGEWSHVCGTFKNTGAANNLNIYKNGRLVVSRTYAGSGITVVSPLRFMSGSSLVNSFNGSLDNLFIARREFPALEVQKIYELMHSGKERQNLP
jgi:hypothetical protein